MENIKIPTQKNSLSQRFLSGASWVLAGKIVSACATLAGYALLARILSPDELGSYFIVFSLISILSICSMWGLDRGMVKLVASELAQGNAPIVRAGIKASLIIVTTLSVFITLILVSPIGKWLLINGLDSAVIVPLTLLMGLWVIFRALQGVVRESFRGFHNIRMATIFGGLVTAVMTMLLYMVLWVFEGGASLERVIVFTVIGAGISVLAGLFYLYRKLQTLEKSTELPILKIMGFGFPLFLTSASLFGIQELHLWVLAFYQPESEVALYGSALRLGVMLTMPLIIVNSVIPPMIADLYSQNKFIQVQNVLQKTATLMSLPAIAVSVMVFIFGGDILSLIYGETYRGAYIVFVILTVGQLLNVMTGSPGILLTMSGHERIVMRSAISSGIIGVIVSIYCVQLYGAVGAAIGYSVGIVLLNIAMCIFAYKKMSINTFSSPKIMISIVRKARLYIESDHANGGQFSKMDRIVGKIESFWWSLRGYNIIECLGDSHVSVFRAVNYTNWVRDKRFRTVSVRGATAYGVGNPNSKTNALKVFQHRLKSISPSHQVLFMMGEVDVGFLSWLRAQKKEMNPMLCMEEAFLRYIDFLSTIKKTHSNLVVCSVPLPTISDDKKKGEVADSRSEVKATQRERTEMTLIFNIKLKNWAESSDTKYLDFDIYALDEKTQLVRKQLLNKKTTDHHYETNEFVSMIRKLIHMLD